MLVVTGVVSTFSKKKKKRSDSDDKTNKLVLLSFVSAVILLYP